ncbi:uncharacterized protein LOC122244263 [Penaeus japonicus]|uniref:uncharacterized protein LOC122244263 n=1 Tax=Penaeus japonicus TaxID=27405 RepID=UPI001C70D4A2|nr:uncharacterized protein LOC122244263 [Penaeus japonicus]
MPHTADSRLNISGLSQSETRATCTGRLTVFPCFLSFVLRIKRTRFFAAEGLLSRGTSKASQGTKRGGAMAGWQNTVVALLLLAVFSCVLCEDKNCYVEGELEQNEGYFYCSKPRLEFNDTGSELVMDFRNRNNMTIFTISLNRTADAFYFNVVNKTGKLNKSKKLRLNISRSSVHAKTKGTWQKLDIPETDQIFSLYFRSYPANPAFCITCDGEDIWDDKATEPPTTQATEQEETPATQPTKQAKTGTLWWLCFILVPIFGLILYKRKYLCEKMGLLCETLRNCCHRTCEATTESERGMSGHFCHVKRDQSGLVSARGIPEAGQAETEGVETENDIYVSADVQPSEIKEYGTLNNFNISADVHQVKGEEYETVNDMYMSADGHQFGIGVC